MYDDMKTQVKLLQDKFRENKKYMESLEKMIINIGNIVDFPISSTSIRDIYRVPGNSPN